MSMTTPGIDNGLYEYDMSVIYYTTVTICNVYVTYGR